MLCVSNFFSNIVLALSVCAEFQKIKQFMETEASNINLNLRYELCKVVVCIMCSGYADWGRNLACRLCACKTTATHTV